MRTNKLRKLKWQDLENEEKSWIGVSQVSLAYHVFILTGHLELDEQRRRALLTIRLPARTQVPPQPVEEIPRQIDIEEGGEAQEGVRTRKSFPSADFRYH